MTLLSATDIADLRALAASGMYNTFTTSRGSTGPCMVVHERGDGTPITVHALVTADIRPSDTIVIGGRTYRVMESPPLHGLSVTMQLTLQETARP